MSITHIENTQVIEITNKFIKIGYDYLRISQIDYIYYNEFSKSFQLQIKDVVHSYKMSKTKSDKIIKQILDSGE